MENGYCEKQNIKMQNEYIAESKIIIENQIQKILKKNAKNLLGYIPTKLELVTEYLFNKFQK